MRVPIETQQAIAAGYKNSTLRQLSLKYQLSHETIRRVLLKHGIKMRKKGEQLTPGGKPRLGNALPPQYREEDVVSALLKGTDAKDIADYLKVKRGIISMIARRNGLVRMRGEWSRA